MASKESADKMNNEKKSSGGSVSSSSPVLRSEFIWLMYQTLQTLTLDRVKEAAKTNPLVAKLTRNPPSRADSGLAKFTGDESRTVGAYTDFDRQATQKRNCQNHSSS